jgi:hypothetical protein
MVRSRLLLGFALLTFGCEARDPQSSVSSPAASPPGLSARFAGRDPMLRWDSTGNLHVIYVEDRAGGNAVLYRRLGPEPFDPVVVSTGVETARSEAPPTLEVLPGNVLLAAWSAPMPGRWKSEIRSRRSTDGGRTWEEPRLIHPESSVSHSFLSSTATPSGVVFAWLDSRSGKMGLYSSFTRDGVSFSADPSLDPETCQCCGTAMAAGSKGEAWLAYRDLETGDLRDFQVLRSRADPPRFASAAKLSEDGWRIQGCPETGARLVEAPDGTLWAAWFTAGGEPGVYVTSSGDGGASFAARTLLSPPGRPGRHPEIGVLPDGRIAVLYDSLDDGGGPSVMGRLRDPNGAWGDPQRLAPGCAHPRLSGSQGRAAVAFTCREGDTSSIVVREWPFAG